VVLADGKPITAIVLQVGDARVQAIQLIANPRKLNGLTDVNWSTV
jgi:hypothetical protein